MLERTLRELRGQTGTVQDEWAISDGYFDVEGVWHPTPERTREALRAAMGHPVPGPPLWFVPAGETQHLWNPCSIRLEDGTEIGPVTELPADLPLGYHDLVPSDGGPSTRLFVHPAQCPQIPTAWGVAAQIYALWSQESWGIGDLRDLSTVAAAVGRAGGGAMLVSPLHQPAPTLPQEDSPYYPSSRRAWNPLLLAMDGSVPEPLHCSADSLVDRDAVWREKRAALMARYRDERAAGISRPVPGAPVTVACWNALCEELGPDWRTWPAPWNRFEPAALADRLGNDPEFAERARFHQWCQGQIATQLEAVAEHGVAVIGDLAVGFSPQGADAWEYQDMLALDTRIGAPPDTFSLDGQDWGIPPFTPWRVRNAGYQPLIETIRAALRGVQGLRIDHVMGLFRQFWIPVGHSATEGAYVSYPADELLAIICIEAARANAFVVGEDLGTVEPHVRERLAQHRIAGTRVLWFEEDLPSHWPAECLATVTTHDLPTVAGVLRGTDGGEQHRERLEAVLPHPQFAATDPGPVAVDAVDAVDAAHAALLSSPARLRLLAMDDLCLTPERPNHPGTMNGVNWRRRLPLPVDQLRLPMVPDDGARMTVHE
jgi:4-alpha-glucanotransferase